MVILISVCLNKNIFKKHLNGMVVVKSQLY